MALKTCIQQKYAIYDFKSRMYPQRNQQNVSLRSAQNVCKVMNMKVNQSITKLITQADTLQTKILTLQEDNCRNQEI